MQLQDNQPSWPSPQELRAQNLDHVVDRMRRFIAEAHSGCRGGGLCPIPDEARCACRDAALQGLHGLLVLDPSLLHALRRHPRGNGD